MSLNDVKFNLGQGGLGRPLAGEDFISALIFYSDTLPSGFTTASRIKKFFSVADAENAGIKGDNSDATAATATYTVTLIGANGDTVELIVAGPGGNVSLGVYKQVAGDSSVTLVATAIAALINSGTDTHGYSATSALGVVTITAPKSTGVYLNTGTPLSATYSAAATLTGTIAQFTGGVASLQAPWHYHIKEYFRLRPQGVLYVGIYAVPTPYTFTEIVTVQNFADGKIRQFGIFKDPASAFASGDLTLIHSQCNACVTAHKETIALYAADISGTADISTLADLSTLSANLVSAVIGQDGGGLGLQLFQASGKSITVLGALLGAIATAKVSESIAWVSKFNISDGYECDTIAFANGVLFSNVSVTDSLLSTMQNMRYIFLRKFVGVAGSYFNESSTAIALSSDYAYISDNRTIQKATRGIYANVVPALNSPITLNSDGTLADESIAYFQGLTEGPLNQMVRDGELSGFAVTIDAAQNILSTGILTINVNLLQIATGRNIQVNIGYKVTV
jgi:hypothetical protein